MGLKYWLVWGHVSDLPAMSESFDMLSVLLGGSPALFSWFRGHVSILPCLKALSILKQWFSNCGPEVATSASLKNLLKLQTTGPTSDPVNQKLWRWHSPAICLLTSPPDDSKALSSLRTPDFKASSRAFQTQRLFPALHPSLYFAQDPIWERWHCSGRWDLNTAKTDVFPHFWFCQIPDLNFIILQRPHPQKILIQNKNRLF